MDDSRRVRGLNRVRDLFDNRAHFVNGKSAQPLGVFLEKLARRPFDGEKMHPRPGLANFDRSYDVRMLYAFAVARFTKKTRDSGAILPQFFPEHLHGDDAVVAVLRAADGGCTAFSHFALQRISGNRLSDEILTRHAANLISAATRRKRTD